MKINKKFIPIIISLSYILASLLGIVHICCFDINFYDSQHNKLTLSGKSINEYIGISKDELSELTSFTLNYLNNPNASLDKKLIIKGNLREVFNDDEKTHMVDVRNLNLLANKICIISLILFLISFFIFIFIKADFFILFNTYKKVLLFTLIFFLFIGIWIFIDFDSFWDSFHHLFFSSNDLWLLSLSTDILIMIVPPDFFNHLVIRILLFYVFVVILFYIVLYLLSRKKLYTK